MCLNCLNFETRMIVVCKQTNFRGISSNVLTFEWMQWNTSKYNAMVENTSLKIDNFGKLV